MIPEIEKKCYKSTLQTNVSNRHYVNKRNISGKGKMHGCLIMLKPTFFPSFFLQYSVVFENANSSIDTIKNFKRRVRVQLILKSFLFTRFVCFEFSCSVAKFGVSKLQPF